MSAEVWALPVMWLVPSLTPTDSHDAGAAGLGAARGVRGRPRFALRRGMPPHLRLRDAVGVRLAQRLALAALLAVAFTRRVAAARAVRQQALQHDGQRDPGVQALGVL